MNGRLGIYETFLSGRRKLVSDLEYLGTLDLEMTEAVSSVGWRKVTVRNKTKAFYNISQRHI